MSTSIFKFGVIAGVVLSLLFLGPILINPDSYMDPDAMASGEIIGYAIMIGSMLIVAWGMFSYSKTYKSAGFGKLFLVGLGITAVANLLFYLGNLMVYEVFAPDFLRDFGIHYEENTLAKSANPEERRAMEVELATMRPVLENSYLYAALMAGTTFFIGIIISALSALFLALTKRS